MLLDFQRQYISVAEPPVCGTLFQLPREADTVVKKTRNSPPDSHTVVEPGEPLAGEGSLLVGRARELLRSVFSDPHFDRAGCDSPAVNSLLHANTLDLPAGETGLGNSHCAEM